MKSAALANSLLKLIEKKEGAVGNRGTGGHGSSVWDELTYEKQKYLDDSFNILFAGEIKTGKSSLVNNLLGLDVCTVAPGVCTNVNTVIHYGSEERITVHFNPDKDGSVPEPQTISRKEIREYVSEKSNRNNKRNVRIIEVEEPLDILKEGETFIDTPGLGSLNPYHAATTFSMAPMADVIVMVSHRDLTTDEVDYIQRLLSASKSAALIHVLTNSDAGDPETTLRENDKHLRKIAKAKGISYMSCAVSNILYEKIRNGEPIQIKDTGFDVLAEMMGSLRKASWKIRTERLLAICHSIISGYINEDQVLIDAINDPKVAEEKKKELLEIQKRIEQLESNSEEWKLKLGTKIAKYKNHVDSTVRVHFDKVRAVTEEKLFEKDYLKHPDKLGALVSSEIVSKKAGVEASLAEDLQTLYSELCDETGMTLICEGLHPIKNPSGTIELKKPKVEWASIYRSAIASRVFFGTVIGGIVGGVIGTIAGGVIGTIAAPGAGTVAGAVEGAKLGAEITSIAMAIKGAIVGKERVNQAKRDKILSKVRPFIAEEQSSYLVKVKDVISDAEEKLRIAFAKALKSEKNHCKEQLQEITNTINGDKSKLASYESEINYLRKLEGILSEIEQSMYEE